MRKINLATTLWSCLLAVTVPISSQTPTPEGSSAAAYRDPFTVKYEFAGKGKVEQKFDKSPYVSEKTIYVFPGEEFGINVRREGEEIVEISYQPDLKKADVTFKFEAQKTMMLLTTKSELDKMLVMEGWMLLPGRNEPVKTSLLPVQPHLFGIESWPHPIVKVELKNLRLSTPPKGRPGPRQ